jgi:hypothetical protein
LASVLASQEEEIVKDLLDKLNKSKASNQELTICGETNRVSTQKRMLTLEEQAAKASQSVQQSTKDAPGFLLNRATLEEEQRDSLRQEEEMNSLPKEGSPEQGLL